jgi:hypothetical protein
MSTTELDAILDDAVNAEREAEVDEPDEETTATAAEEGSEDDADPDPRAHLDNPPEEEAGEGPGPAAATTISELVGVPLFYERAPVGPPAKARSFPVDPTFVPVLEQTVREVKARVPAEYGELVRIVSAGFRVGNAGMHGKGRACDWDRLVFENVEIAPLDGDHAGPKKAAQRYWGFAAICRANSAFVLHGFYDALHRDHIHQDNMASLNWNPGSEAGVKLAQAVLNTIFGNNLDIDGKFGTDTSNALKAAIAKVGLNGPVEDVTTWRKFLRRSGRLGFVLGAEV